MSIENHPNINAAGFTVDIMDSFIKHLRGKARDIHYRSVAFDIIHDELINFITKVSSDLDVAFGE